MPVSELGEAGAGESVVGAAVGSVAGCSAVTPVALLVAGTMSGRIKNTVYNNPRAATAAPGTNHLLVEFCGSSDAGVGVVVVAWLVAVRSVGASVIGAAVGLISIGSVTANFQARSGVFCRQPDLVGVDLLQNFAQFLVLLVDVAL